jgi:hypothetical protein
MSELSGDRIDLRGGALWGSTRERTGGSATWPYARLLATASTLEFRAGISWFGGLSVCFERREIDALRWSQGRRHHWFSIIHRREGVTRELNFITGRGAELAQALRRLGYPVEEPSATPDRSE